MKKVGCFFAIVIVMVVIPDVQANWTESFTNGSFSSPLSVGWTNYSNVSIVSGQAVLQESKYDSTFLEQYFTLSPDMTGLSFQYLASFDNGPSDSFSVSLLDSSRNPLINSNPNPLDPSESYFFMQDSLNGLFIDNTFVSIRNLDSGWTQVDFDLSSLAGSSHDTILSFDLIGNFTAPFESRIVLDNVVVPLPGTLILTLTGLLSASVLKRFRK